MAESKISTPYFERQVDDRADFKEQCLAAIVVLLGEIRNALIGLKEMQEAQNG